MKRGRRKNGQGLWRKVREPGGTNGRVTYET